MSEQKTTLDNAPIDNAPIIKRISVGGLQVTPKKRELIDKVMKMDDKQLDLLEKLLDATEQATK